MRLKWRVMYLIVMLSNMVISNTVLCECRKEGFLPIPGLQIFGARYQECIFPNVTEFRKAQGQGPQRYGGWGIDINIYEIPESGKDIYYFYEGGFQGSTIYFSLTFPPEDAIKFAGELAGVPISEFKEGEIGTLPSQVIPDFIVEGPVHYGEKWKTPYWRLKEVKNGKYTQKKGSNDYIIIDLDTNRVYLSKLK